MGDNWFYALNFLFNNTICSSRLEPKYLRAYQLLHHPRNKQVRKQPWMGYIIVDSKKRLEGLTKPLKAVFYPYQKCASTGGARTGGSARGNMADREIAALVNHGTIPANGFSKYTIRILEYLRRLQLQPFASQFIVYDDNIGIATELDLLCVDHTAPATDNVVNVQVKTGFDLNYEANDGEFLSSPYVANSKLARIHKNHRNCHQLQNLVEHMIVQLNYNRLLRESVVMVFSEEVSSLYRIGKDLMDAKMDIYQNLYKRQFDSDMQLQIKGITAGAAAKKAKKLFT